MPKFKVPLRCEKVFYKTFEVEADDEDEAEEAARDQALDEDRVSEDEGWVESTDTDKLNVDGEIERTP